MSMCAQLGAAAGLIFAAGAMIGAENHELGWPLATIGFGWQLKVLLIDLGAV